MSVNFSGLFNNGFIKQKKFKPSRINTPEFYKQHPDLAPRNIYLREGRMITPEDWKKTLKRMDRINQISDFINLVKSKLKHFFNKFNNKITKNQ